MLSGARRQWTKMGSRSADESQVALLLKDFVDADQMLEKLIASTKAWRDSWRDILAFQERLVNQFHGMYLSIPGSTPDHEPRHTPVETPPENIERVAKLVEAYSDLRNDLSEEVDQIEDRIIKPATDARTSIQPLKKVIKKREDRKLDYERFQKKFDVGSQKQVKSDKDRVAMARVESDLAIATREYETADEKLRANLPPIISAAFQLLPHLLSMQVIIQNSLLAAYYTSLHNYCQDTGFPSPPPEMSEINAVWENDFKTLQSQIETGFAMISSGKAVRQPFHQQGQKGSTITGLNVRNGIKGRMSSSSSVPRVTSGTSTPGSSRLAITPAPSEHSEPPSPNLGSKPPVNLTNKPSFSSEPEYNTKVSNVPYQGPLGVATPNYSSDASSPGGQTPHYPAAPRADYFSRERTPSSSMAAAAASKKKPPPPPPPKKKQLGNQGLWVTALYDFAGQSHGDLSFREGDRIKVIKKTGSTDDWWEGELQGTRGPFPANYVQMIS